jgi:fructokinase
MADWGMDLTSLETDPSHPTGVVEVHFAGGDHSFDILPNQAYDRISQAQLEKAISQEPGLLYHGTLVMRTDTFRNLFSTDRMQSGAPRFVDLNLREPWWSEEWLGQCLQQAKWAKVNEIELDTAAHRLSCLGRDQEESAKLLRERLGLELLIVTLGERGAFAFSAEGIHAAVVPERLQKVVDTIGAGDAFAAVTILGLLLEWPLETILERAHSFAGRIVQQKGATSHDASMYVGLSKEWELP